MRTQAIGAGFEGLEERLLLAGSVTSAVVAGTLVLDGDGLANQVQLTVASNGQLTATGLSGTTINGVTSFNFGVVSTPLIVNGGAGDDTISMNSTAATIANNVTIDGGIGNDTITATGRFGTNLVIDGGTGLDTISVSKATVAVNLDLDAGDGNDKVTLSDSTVARDALIQSGLDNDSVTIKGMAIHRNLALSDTGGTNLFTITNSSTRNDTLVVLGDGNDTLIVTGLTAGVKTGAAAQGLISIDFGDGKNVLAMSKTKALGTIPLLLNPLITPLVITGDGIAVIGGTGNDSFGITDTQAAGGVLINTGDGINRLEMTRVQITGIGDLRITTGLAIDNLKLDRVNADDNALIDTGLGNDVFQLTNSRFTGLFNADLGGGDDSAYLSGNFFANGLSEMDGGVSTFDALTLGAGNSPRNNLTITAFEIRRNKVL